MVIPFWRWNVSSWNAWLLIGNTWPWVFHADKPRLQSIQNLVKVDIRSYHFGYSRRMKGLEYYWWSKLGCAVHVLNGPFVLGLQDTVRSQSIRITYSPFNSSQSSSEPHADSPSPYRAPHTAHIFHAYQSVHVLMASIMSSSAKYPGGRFCHFGWYLRSNPPTVVRRKSQLGAVWIRPWKLDGIVGISLVWQSRCHAYCVCSEANGILCCLSPGLTITSLTS